MLDLHERLRTINLPHNFTFGAYQSDDEDGDDDVVSRGGDEYSYRRTRTFFVIVS